jgi:hypothetical protein
MKFIHSGGYLLGLAWKAKRHELVWFVFLDPQRKLADWSFPIPGRTQNVLNFAGGKIKRFGIFCRLSFDAILDGTPRSYLLPKPAIGQG